MEPMVFQFIGGTVTAATDAFLNPTIERLVLALNTFVLFCVTIYVLVTGFAIIGGFIERPIEAFAKQAFKIVLIVSIALSVGAYSSLVMGLFTAFEGMLSGALNTSGRTATDIYQLLDQSLGQGLEIVARCYAAADNAGFNIGSAIGWIIAGSVVAAGTVVITGLGAGVVIVAKFSLAIMFALGPLFLITLIFPAVSSFFDKWVAQVLNYTLVIVILAVVMTFAMAAFTAFIGEADFDGGQNPIVAALQILVLAGILAWIILQANGIASGLAGGMSSAAMTLRHMATPARMATGGASAARNLVDPRSTRRDLESGMMTTARRSNHLVAGNTVANPAYRQHVLQQAGKNWGRAKGGKASR